MNCFCKAEIAGVVENVSCDRELQKLRLLIQVPPECVDVVTLAKDFLSEYGCSDYIVVEVTDEAYDLLLGKVFDFDYIHVLADLKLQSAFERFPIKFKVTGAGQIINHEARTYLSEKDVGFDIYKPLKSGYLI